MAGSASPAGISFCCSMSLAMSRMLRSPSTIASRKAYTRVDSACARRAGSAGTGLGEGLRFGKMLGGQRFPLLSPVRIGGGLLQTVFTLLLVINRSFQKRLGVSRRRVLSLRANGKNCW